MPQTKSDMNGAEVLLEQLECQGVVHFRLAYRRDGAGPVRFLIGFS
jgi:hypothetical protein